MSIIRKSDNRNIPLRLMVAGLLILFSAEYCLANPISFPISWMPERSNLALAAGVNTAVDFLVVIGALAAMQELAAMDKLHLACYIILMVIGGFIIDSVAIGAANVIMFIPNFNASFYGFGAIFFITSFILLLGFNYLLSRRLLDIPVLKCFLLASAAAIFTNPAYLYILTASD